MRVGRSTRKHATGHSALWWFSRTTLPWFPLCAASHTPSTISVVVLLEIRRRRNLALLHHLPRQGLDQLLHRHDLAVLRREEGGVQRDVADVAAGDRKLLGEKLKVDVFAQRHLGREHAAPQLFAVALVGQRELDDVVHAPREGLVDVLAQIAREDHDAFVFFDLLQQVRDFDVGVAIVRVLALRNACRRARRLRRRTGSRCSTARGAKDAIEILLGLADVLADDAGEIDLVEVEPELARDRLRQSSSCRCPKPRRRAL